MVRPDHPKRGTRCADRHAGPCELPIRAAFCVMLRSQRGKSFHRQRQSTVYADDEPHPYKRVEMLGANHRGISALDVMQGGKVNRIYKSPWAAATGHGTSLPCLLLTKITPPLQRGASTDGPRISGPDQGRRSQGMSTSAPHLLSACCRTPLSWSDKREAEQAGKSYLAASRRPAGY